MISIKNSIKVVISIALNIKGPSIYRLTLYPLFGTITLINKSDLQFESRTPENVWSRSGKRFYCARAPWGPLLRAYWRTRAPWRVASTLQMRISKRPCSFRGNPYLFFTYLPSLVWVHVCFLFIFYGRFFYAFISLNIMYSYVNSLKLLAPRKYLLYGLIYLLNLRWTSILYFRRMQ